MRVGGQRGTAHDGVAERGVQRIDGGECALGRVDRRTGEHVGEAEPRGVEQPSPLRCLGQPCGGRGRGGAGIGAEAHLGELRTFEAQGEPHAVIAAATTSVAVAVGLVDRAGAG